MSIGGNPPNLKFNFHGASDLTIDFSNSKDFATIYPKIPKNFFKNAKNITIKIFNPFSQCKFLQKLIPTIKDHFNNKDINFEIKE